jgi:PhnB protein
MSAGTTPYLFFDGNCREAMTFYQKVLGGELALMTYGESPQCPEGAQDRLIHAGLVREGRHLLMASDTPTTDDAPKVGDHIQIALECRSLADVEQVFRGLGVEGEVVMPLAQTFFATRFGMLTDRYGLKWMITFTEQKK